MVLTELLDLHSKVGWKGGSPLWRIISPLKNASIQHLQEMDGRQVMRSASGFLKGRRSKGRWEGGREFHILRILCYIEFILFVLISH